MYFLYIMIIIVIVIINMIFRDVLIVVGVIIFLFLFFICFVFFSVKKIIYLIVKRLFKECVWNNGKGSMIIKNNNVVFIWNIDFLVYYGKIKLLIFFWFLWFFFVL